MSIEALTNLMANITISPPKMTSTDLKKLGTKKIREHCQKYFEEQKKATVTRKRTITKEFEVQVEITVAKEEDKQLKSTNQMNTVPEEAEEDFESWEKEFDEEDFYENF
ncbi:hypothetical protein B9Z55_007673 [Caenorhabditis nigoni]|uniref:Uncharacterized protein n=1 Tax=Caenorhabditis nigoni TaxID=1611254 RepID=A0A2G5VAR4_9PELO|nr:hypothetical protein B9Z55_007673 [Caenorhabditis nigoni]